MLLFYLLSFYFRRCSLTQFNASTHVTRHLGCIAQFELMVRYKNQSRIPKGLQNRIREIQRVQENDCISLHFVVVFTLTGTVLLA